MVIDVLQTLLLLLIWMRLDSKQGWPLKKRAYRLARWFKHLVRGPVE